MRYVKNSVVIQTERDIPLLRQLRNSKFASHSQLFELMRFSGSEASRDSFGWRVRRLLKAGFLAICEGAFGADSPVYRITREGIALLEHHGQFTTVLHSKTAHLPHVSQVFHSLELNRIQLALASANLLANWQSEIEIASFNTISYTPYQKDYDAIVDVWLGDKMARFALEYERCLKSYRQYDRIRAALQAERQVGWVLFLTSGMEVLVHLVHELNPVPNKLAFADARDFEQTLLETRVVTACDLTGTNFRELLQ
jgi:Replication-relaxation